MLHRDEGRRQHDLDQSLKGFCGKLFNRGDVLNTGIVHQNIQAAVSFLDGVHRISDLRFLCHITRNGFCVKAFFGKLEAAFSHAS